MRRRDELAFVVFSTWTIAGLFVDGWAHGEGQPESFFTPWHGLLYSGFVAGMLWTVLERVRAARRGEALPVGDRLAPIGGVLFLAGGVGDMVWHTVFGIEEDLAALLSPTHLLLMVAGLLLTTAPMRSGWSARRADQPTLSDLGTQIVSLALSSALVGFFVVFANPLVPFTPMGDNPAIDAAGVLITNIVLLAPLVWFAARTPLPRGAALVYLSVVVLFLLGLDGFERSSLLLAAVAGGLAAEATRTLAARRDAVGLAAFGGAVAAATWTTFFILSALQSALDTEAELWTGPLVLATLTGVALDCMSATGRGAMTAEEFG